MKWRRCPWFSAALRLRCCVVQLFHWSCTAPMVRSNDLFGPFRQDGLYTCLWSIVYKDEKNHLSLIHTQNWRFASEIALQANIVVRTPAHLGSGLISSLSENVFLKWSKTACVAEGLDCHCIDLRTMLELGMNCTTTSLPSPSGSLTTPGGLLSINTGQHPQHTSRCTRPTANTIAHLNKKAAPKKRHQRWKWSEHSWTSTKV